MEESLNRSILARFSTYYGLIPYKLPPSLSTSDAFVAIMFTKALEMGSTSTPKSSDSSQPDDSGPISAVHNQMDDTGHPAAAGNWPQTKKLFVVATGIFLTFNATFGSSLPSGGTDALAQHFSVTQPEQISLPVAIFLIGYIFGPILFAPLSETYGRWICLTSSFAIYTLFTLACALAPNWPALLIFRFLCGVGAAAPQTVLGGVFADIYPDLRPRGKAVMLLALISTVGPLIGPIVAGYTSVRDWRWMFWIALILAGVNWPFLLMLPESYEPVILMRLEKRAISKNEQVVTLSHRRAEHINVRELMVVVLMRPIRMFLEPMVLFTDLFLVLEYSMFFLYFEAYPFIFKGKYGMSPGEAALMLLPVGLGVTLAAFVCLWYDRFLANAKARGKAWASRDEYRRLPLVCVGGPLNAMSQFWLAWSSRPNVHWVVPMLSGVLFGLGVDLIFMGLTNYLTDSYGVYSASAMASSVFSRNIAAALLLPLASYRMYEQLGVPWACSILGFAGFAMSTIPFGFIWYGPKLSEKSKFCQRLKQRELTREKTGVDL